MVTRSDYAADEVDAAKSVLIELVHLLGEYHDEIVVVGGWVPALILPEGLTRHAGSIDIDLALDHRRIGMEAYARISKLLEERGYRPDGHTDFVWRRTVSLSGHEPIEVEVDFLAGEYEGTGPRHRHQRVQDLKARKARGCDLAFDEPVEVELDGRLPSGARDTVRVRVASIVPFIVTKCSALRTRIREKDAYDIYFCLRHYPGGVPAVTQEFEEHAGQGLVAEALRTLAEKFATIDSFGPVAIADFEEIADADERAVLMRDAFELVQYLVRGLGELG